MCPASLPFFHDVFYLLTSLCDQFLLMCFHLRSRQDRPANIYKLVVPSHPHFCQQRGRMVALAQVRFSCLWGFLPATLVKDLEYHLAEINVIDKGSLIPQIPQPPQDADCAAACLPLRFGFLWSVYLLYSGLLIRFMFRLRHMLPLAYLLPKNVTFVSDAFTLLCLVNEPPPGIPLQTLSRMDFWTFICFM
jgi:hypothetical protein